MTATTNEIADVSTLTEDQLLEIVITAAKESRKLACTKTITPEYEAYLKKKSEWDSYMASGQYLDDAFADIAIEQPRLVEIPEWLRYTETWDPNIKLVDSQIWEGCVAPPRYAPDIFPLARAADLELSHRRQIAREKLVEERNRQEAAERSSSGAEWFRRHIPVNYQHCTISNFIPLNESHHDVLRSLTTWDTKKTVFLTIGGPPGVGKTHLAVGLVHHFCTQGFQPVFTDEEQLLARWQACHEAYDDRESEMQKPGDYLHELAHENVLILDDLGTAALTDKGAAALWRVLSYRFDHNKMTIFTTNYKLDDLGRLRGTKLISRISAGINCWMEGTDMRGRPIPIAPTRP